VSRRFASIETKIRSRISRWSNITRFPELELLSVVGITHAYFAVVAPIHSHLKPSSSGFWSLIFEIEMASDVNRGARREYKFERTLAPLSHTVPNGKGCLGADYQK
jgi:hypothetical protein